MLPGVILPRALIVREARRPQAAGTRILPYLRLREDELLLREIVAFLHVVEAEAGRHGSSDA